MVGKLAEGLAGAGKVDAGVKEGGVALGRLGAEAAEREE